MIAASYAWAWWVSGGVFAAMLIGGLSWAAFADEGDLS